MVDNVISLGSGRSYLQEQAEKAAAVQIETELIEKEISEAQASHKRALLEMLTNTIKLVEDDQLEGVVMVGRHKTSKLFYTDVILDERITPFQEMFAYVGCLETLKMEFIDMSAMAPCLRADGTMLNPSEPYLDEGDYDD